MFDKSGRYIPISKRGKPLGVRPNPYNVSLQQLPEGRKTIKPKLKKWRVYPVVESEEEAKMIGDTIVKARSAYEAIEKAAKDYSEISTIKDFLQAEEYVPKKKWSVYYVKGKPFNEHYPIEAHTAEEAIAIMKERNPKIAGLWLQAEPFKPKYAKASEMKMFDREKLAKLLAVSNMGGEGVVEEAIHERKSYSHKDPMDFIEQKWFESLAEGTRDISLAGTDDYVNEEVRAEREANKILDSEIASWRRELKTWTDQHIINHFRDRKEWLDLVKKPEFKVRKESFDKRRSKAGAYDFGNVKGVDYV